jgi:integrase
MGTSANELTTHITSVHFQNLHEAEETTHRESALFTHADHTDWALVGTGDVEAFLARIDNPGYRARQLHALQVFFRFARQHRHILADPTRRLNANSNKPFHGRVLDPERQRELFHRWTCDTADLHPHEPVIDLLGLLHGTSATEVRSIRVGDVDLTATTAVLDERIVCRRSMTSLPWGTESPLGIDCRVPR